MKVTPFSVHFDGMSWPRPGDDTDPDLEWVMRYAQPSRSDMLRAASIIAAYRELLTCTDRKRRYVIRQIRKAANESASLPEGK